MEQSLPHGQGEVGVVIATRNRCDELLATLERLVHLPDRLDVTVVDNGSTDGTAAAVRDAYPQVSTIGLERNLGAAARTVGVRQSPHDVVAFSDDDSWWAPGSLRAGSRLFAAHERIGLVAARIVVEPSGRIDPTSVVMSSSPLPLVAGAGPRVLGFLACGAMVRREAYLDVGGFEPRYCIGGEEALLALDLAAAGWDLVYAEHVVAHHRPSKRREPAVRRRSLARNGLWTTWLRRRGLGLVAGTARVARACLGDRHSAQGVVDAVRGATWVAQARSPLPPHVERACRLVERHPGAPGTRREPCTGRRPSA